jgi:hypothetical protein
MYVVSGLTVVLNFSIYNDQCSLCSRQWVDAPADMMAQRKQAIAAAVIEREELKREAAEVRRKAKLLRKQDEPPAAAKPAPAPASAPAPAPVPSTPAASAAPAAPAAAVLSTPAGEVVYIKGREEAVRMMDMMMADEEFMRYQEELYRDVETKMGDQIASGGRLRAQSFLGRAGLRREEKDDVGELDDKSAANRADLVSKLQTPS